MTPPRRSDDRALLEIIGDVAELKRAMKENTEITRQVLEVLATFRVIASVAKWVTAVIASVGAVYIAFKTGVDWVNHK